MAPNTGECNDATGTLTIQSVDSQGVINAFSADSDGQIAFCSDPEGRQLCLQQGGTWDTGTCSCVLSGGGGPASPIVITERGNHLELTDAEHGVNFDLNSDGEAERIAWSAPNTDAAFLVLDRSQDRQINDGTELFGNFTPQPTSDQPNGFAALAVFDDPVNGGNGDGLISAQDQIFEQLLLWFDNDHDGLVLDSSELRPLSSEGILSISLDYWESRRQDQFGNQFRFTSLVETDGTPARKFAVDVFLVAGQ